MSAPIPMLDLAAAHAPLAEDLRAAATRVIDRGRYILGPELETLEGELATSLGVEHVLGCASGTDALILALQALDLRPADEVLVPAVTFVATAEAVVRAGLTPVFVDIDPASGLIDPASCNAQRTDRTRAVIVVHLYGRPAREAPLREALRGLHVIEDCAQCFGSPGAGRFPGSLQAYSFFPSKNLGGFGDGGAVATTDPARAQAVRSLRNHGSRDTYLHDRIGMNSRLDEIQAALLRIKLPHVPAWNRARRKVAGRYSEILREVAGLQLPEDHADHVWHQYTVRSPARDSIHARLAEDAIDSRVYYPLPLHRQDAYRLYARGDLPAAERWCRECLSLPIYPELDEVRIARVCHGVRGGKS